MAEISPPIVALNVRALALQGTGILGELQLSLNPAETLALIGPSGVGKSSVLRIIAGLETRYTGSLNVRGKVAMVFQEPTLLPWRSLVQNLCIPTGITRAQALSALEEVGLGARADAYPGQLSLGQQRRLSLARAFAVKPDVLLLDEPFVSLDPALVQEMMALYRALRQAHGVATILVTHVQAEAEALADRIVRLEGTPGRIAS